MAILADIAATAERLVHAADEAAEDHEPAGVNRARMNLERLGRQLDRLTLALAEPRPTPPRR